MEHCLSMSSREASKQKHRGNHRTQREISAKPPYRKNTAYTCSRTPHGILLISFLHLLEDRPCLVHPCSPYLLSLNLWEQCNKCLLSQTNKEKNAFKCNFCINICFGDKRNSTTKGGGNREATSFQKQVCAPQWEIYSSTCVHKCMHAKLLQSCPTLCDPMDPT